VLIFLLIWIVPTHFPVPLELRVLLAIVGGVLAALVFFKMMTRRLPTATCLILGWMIISGALLGLVVHLFGR
jgi:predicted membrane-bound spermidine synthase